MLGGMKRLTFACLLVLVAGGVAHPSADQSLAPVQLSFEAVVHGEPVACGRTFANIGTTRSSITISDIRWYVSNIELVSASGTAVPVALEQDGKWQSGTVALLDFEDGSATCANGTPDTRAVVTGSAPAGEYVGVRFTVGLPFDVNHRDPTTQPSPLNLSRMFWNWNAGYKFARIDMKSTGQPQGWVLHLGSTTCGPGGGPTVVPATCTHENAPRVSLAPFDAARDVIRFDLGALLAESNVDSNQKDTAAGCMSGQTDDDCAGIFKTLGLPFRTNAAAPQSVFSVRAAGPAAVR
jgi:uncharacterized repeat protein (TIGR04052 family)